MAELLRVENLVKTYAAPGGLFGRRRSTALDGVSISVARGRDARPRRRERQWQVDARPLHSRPDAARLWRDPVRGRGRPGLSGKRLADFRRRVQPVFQDPFGSLDPRWPVGRSVREALDCFGIGSNSDRARRVADLFARVGLDPVFAKRLPSQLSGGQRQRVAIAAALASEPELIVADEPVSALDMSVQAQILNLFMDLKRDLGLAALFITHDLAVVAHVSDAVAVMQQGRIVETGSADAVIDAPSHAYTKALIAAVPRPRPAFRGG